MSGKRSSLSSMLPAATEAPPLPARPPAAARGQAAAVAHAITSEVRSSEVGSSQVRRSEVPEPGTAAVQGLPKYLRLERKDTLLWPGQIAELSVTRRMLNRARHGKGERITENTLIRVAIALLLSRANELDGTTEEELRQSLGLSG